MNKELEERVEEANCSVCFEDFAMDEELQLINDLSQALKKSEEDNETYRYSLKQIAKGQQPIDYAKPMVTIRRLTDLAIDGLLRE